MFHFIAIFCTLSAVQGIVLPRETRIAGGSHQSIEKAPWHVSIQQFVPICGGTILSENYVLTSAHCVEDLDLQNVEVLSGTEYLSKGETSKIQSYEVHPDFNGTDNNIAVIKLQSKINVTDTQKPAVLEASQPSCGELVKFTGFGFTNDGFPTTPIPNDLRTIDLPVWPASLCSHFLKEYSKKDLIICAGIFNGPCFGDEGGPIGQNGTVIGINVKVNCYNDIPALFVNVGAYRSFIDSTTHGEASWK